MIFLEYFIKYFKPKPLPLATIEARLHNGVNTAYKNGKFEVYLDFRAIDISYMRNNNMIKKLSSRFPIKYVNIIGAEPGKKIPPGKMVQLYVEFRYNKNSKEPKKNDISPDDHRRGYTSSSSVSESDSTSYSSSAWTMSEEESI